MVTETFLRRATYRPNVTVIITMKVIQELTQIIDFFYELLPNKL